LECQGFFEIIFDNYVIDLANWVRWRDRQMNLGGVDEGTGITEGTGDVGSIF